MGGYVSTKTGEWVLDDSLDMQGTSGQGSRQDDSASVIDDDSGALVNPATGNTPATGEVFRLTGGLGRIRVQNTGDSIEDFTLTYHFRDETTEDVTETLTVGYDEDWHINTAKLDHLTWASTGTGTSVETY